MTIGLKTKKLFKVKKCKRKMPKKLNIFSLKIHKGAGISKKNPKTFLNKGTKHKKNYMEGLNLKNKNNNIKGGSSL